MNNMQLAIFCLEAIIIAILVLFLFRMRPRFGLTPLYITLGVFQPVQTILASTVYVEILPGVIVSPGSVIMFTASLFVILLVYIFEDATETRKSIYGIMFANLAMTLLLFIFGVQLEPLSTVNLLNLSREVFYQTARAMLVGTIVLFIDAVLLIFAYEAVWRLVTKNLFLRVYLTIAIILTFDSLVFVTGVFYGQSDYVTILSSGIIGKLIMAAFYAFALALYLRFAESSNHQIQPFGDIFDLLSYRQRFEIEHQQRQQKESLLRESEGKYQTLASISPVGIFRTDAEGITTYVNPKWSEISGVPFERALGDGWLDAVHADDRERVYKGWQEATRLHKGSSSDYRFVRPDKTIAWVIGQAVPEISTQNHITGYVGTITDITDRKQAEGRIRSQLQHMKSLRMIDAAISSSFDMSVTLKVVLQQVASQLGADAAAVLLLHPHLQTIEYVASQGFRPGSLPTAPLKLSESYADRVVRERQTIHIPDLIQVESKFIKESFAAYHGTPLTVKGEVKGVLEIYHRSPFAPNAEWRDFLEALAGQTAIAIDNAQLFNGLQSSNTELALAYDATIVGWSRALDLRDKETEGHTQRVTEKTLELARQMRMPEDELVHIRRGALLHDIGKMGVPDAILLKAGELTDMEWEIMRKHPTFAYEMLSPIRYLKSAAMDIPYCHHEKWDGTGYPRGLKGEQIPLAARIFAVVDVWDAITSDRPYRPAWTREKAAEYIREQSGKHFDPQVVEAFLRLVA